MKLKQTIALAASIFVSCGALHAQQQGATSLFRNYDPDLTWSGTGSKPTPKVLLSYPSFTISEDEYRLTITAYDFQGFGGAPWPYVLSSASNPSDDTTYFTTYSVYANGQYIGEFGTTHRAYGAIWTGPSSTTTFTFRESPGPLNLEIRATSPDALTTSAEYSAWKARRHSVAGYVSFGLDRLEGTNNLTEIQNKVASLENLITLLQSQANTNAAAISGVNETVGELTVETQNRLSELFAATSNLQEDLVQQYVALRALIDANTSAIAQNTGDIQSLLDQQALLQNAIGSLQQSLAATNAQVTENAQALLQLIQVNADKIAALEASQGTTTAALAALQNSIDGNKAALETKLQDLEAKLTQLGLDKDAQIAALQAQITSIQGSTVTVTELQTQLTQITTQKDGEIAALEAQLAQLNGSQTTQDAQIAQLRNDLSAAQTGALLTSQALQQQIDALNIQRTTQQTEIAGLTQSLDTAKAEKDSEIAALQQQINEAKQTNNSQDVDISSLNSRLAALQVEKDNQIADLNVKIGNLTNAKTETDQQLSEVQTQLTAQSAANDQKIVSLQGGIDMLLADKAAQDAQIAALQGQMTSLGAEKEQQIEDLKSHIETMTGDTAAKVAALEARIAALETQSTETEAEHTAEKQQLERNLASLRKSINSSESSMSSQMWAIGAGAALIGLTSPGVYDHVKEEGLFDSAPAASGTETESQPFTPGGWFKAPVSSAASAGWIK